MIDTGDMDMAGQEGVIVHALGYGDPTVLKMDATEFLSQNPEGPKGCPQFRRAHWGSTR